MVGVSTSGWGEVGNSKFGLSTEWEEVVPGSRACASPGRPDGHNVVPGDGDESRQDEEERSTLGVTIPSACIRLFRLAEPPSAA